jgi:hypothetical protein
MEAHDAIKCILYDSVTVSVVLMDDVVRINGMLVSYMSPPLVVLCSCHPLGLLC